MMCQSRRLFAPLIGGLLIAVMLMAALVGCAPQAMAHQPRLNPLSESDFFSDRQAARPLMPDTVSRDAAIGDELLNQGTTNGKPAAIFPFPVTMEVLQRGQDRFNIYCAVCHDQAGTGNGMVVQRGFTQPPSFDNDRLRKAPVGYLFDVITNGIGRMPPYASQIPVKDRWAIIAYIRALQLSQHATPDDVPADQRKSLQRTWL